MDARMSKCRAGKEEPGKGHSASQVRHTQLPSAPPGQRTPSAGALDKQEPAGPAWAKRREKGQRRLGSPRAGAAGAGLREAGQARSREDASPPSLLCILAGSGATGDAGPGHRQLCDLFKKSLY